MAYRNTLPGNALFFLMVLWRFDDPNPPPPKKDNCASVCKNAQMYAHNYMMGQIGLASFSFAFLRWRVHLQDLHPNWTMLTLAWTLVPFSDSAVWSCIAIEMWCLFKLPSFLCENNWASMAWKTWSRFVKIDDKNMSQNKIASNVSCTPAASSRENPPKLHMPVRLSW